MSIVPRSPLPWLRPLFLSLAAPPLLAQATEAALRAAMLADLDGGVPHVSRLRVPDACPVCGAPLRELKLRDHVDEGRRIDGPVGESARLCEADSLWVWYRHDERPDGSVVPSGQAAGPVALRLERCDRTLGPLPWDALSVTAAPSPAPETAAISAVTLDGRLAVGSLHDDSVRMWSHGAEERLLDVGQWGVTGLELSPRGNALALARNRGLVQVFALPSGKEMLSVRAPSEWVGSFSFDPGMRFLAMGFQRGPGPDAHAVALLDLRSRRQTSVLPWGKVPTTAFAFRADGALLAIGGHDGRVRIWNSTTQRITLEKSFRLGIGALRFSPDGQRLAVAIGCGYEVQLLATADGTTLGHMELPGEPARCPMPYAHLEFSPDGALLAVGGGGGLHWCSVAEPGEPRRFFSIAGHDSPWFDGPALVTVGQGRRIVWNRERARPAH